MGKLTELDDRNFDQVVGNTKKPMVVELWAPSSKPCLAVAPIVEELVDWAGRGVWAREIRG